MWNLTVFIITVLVLLGYYRWKRRKVTAMLAKMNGPRSLPLLGHIHLLQQFTGADKILHTLMQYGRQYDSPVVAELGPAVHVFLYKPDQIQTALNSPYCLDKALQYSFFNVNRSIFAAPVKLWKLQRKLFTPCFGPGMLPSSAVVLNKKCSTMAELLAQYVGEPQRNYYSQIVTCFLDAICGNAFGVDSNLQRSPLGDKYAEIQDNYIEMVSNRFLNAAYYLQPLYQMTKAYKKEKENFNNFVDLLIKVTKLDEMDYKLDKHFKTNTQQYEDFGAKKPQMFIEKLFEEIQKESEIRQEDIKEHLITMCIAGNDTNASTMASILVMLAMHLDIQERVYQEIVSVCPGEDQYLTIEDAAKLTYTEMVCKETMRLFPVGPLIGRSSERDIELDDEVTIPAGSTVICCIYKVHMDPNVWGPDVEKFNPDHFLPDVAANRHPYTYLPFSGGPRNCMGVRYAWLSMKIMLVHILRRYRLRTTLTMDTLTIKYIGFLKLGDGCAISLEKR